mmetsp:Transcript_8906/g.26161  ORF Transcript_8906/g.26161 Transcript_8906/m.26161 type:complete len:515 (+) Transcript_8906:59-1603(+)
MHGFSRGGADAGAGSASLHCGSALPSTTGGVSCSDQLSQSSSSLASAATWQRSRLPSSVDSRPSTNLGALAKHQPGFGADQTWLKDADPSAGHRQLHLPGAPAQARTAAPRALTERRSMVRLGSSSSFLTQTAGTAEVQLDRRIAGIEADLGAVNGLLNGHLQDADGLLVLRERAQRMCAELDQTRSTRQAFQERADRLDMLLRQERQEREAWLGSFTAALEKTLQDLGVCIDNSLAESNKLMRVRLDDADSMLEKLMHRVDKIVSARDPVGSRDGAALAKDTAEGANVSATSHRGEHARATPYTGSSVAAPSSSRQRAPRESGTQLSLGSAADREAASMQSTMSLPRVPAWCSAATVAALVPTAAAASSSSTAPQPLSTSASVPGSPPESPALPDGFKGLVVAPAPTASGSEASAKTMLESWTELLNENLRLQQRHGQLMHQKRRLGLSRGSTSPSQRSSRSPSVGGSISSPRDPSPSSASLSRSSRSPHPFPPGSKPRSIRVLSQLPIVQEM